MTHVHYYGSVTDPAEALRRYLCDDLKGLMEKHQHSAEVYYAQARGDGPVFKHIAASEIIPGWFAQQQNLAAAHHALFRFYRDLAFTPGAGAE